MRNTADVMSGVQKERPNFGPKQIRNPDGLWVGRKIVEVKLKGEFKEIVTIKKSPYQDEEGEWWIDVSYVQKGQTFVTKFSLADHNIKPYHTDEGAQWNRTNYYKRLFLFLPWI